MPSVVHQEAATETKPATPSSLLCSCVKYVRTQIPDLPIIRTPDDLIPNSEPIQGVAVLLDYNEPHIAVITSVVDAGIWIEETNFHHCKKTSRFLAFDDPHIRGYWAPAYPQYYASNPQSALY